MKPTIWVFCIEPLESRYTQQWHEHFPTVLISALNDKFNVVQIDGIQKNSQTTAGAFLNFSDTNFWKSSQLCNFLERHNNGETSPNDQFIFTDAWNPSVIQLKYMSDLLGLNWKLHGLWHAGSYDPQDFLGRLVGNKPWVRFAEKSFFESFDHNYFATEFHIDMFCKNLFDCNSADIINFNKNKIVRSGWPMEYMQDTLAPFANLEKKDLILFPHRIAPEKQVEIFRDLATTLPQYEFVVCQDKTLTKDEYHTLLGQSKLVFSANLQETLGISWYEGAVVGAIPMVPDRLSYSEMAMKAFKYPSEWTIDYDAYLCHKDKICKKIVNYMTDFDQYKRDVVEQAFRLSKSFFACNGILEVLANGNSY